MTPASREDDSRQHKTIRFNVPVNSGVGAVIRFVESYDHLDFKEIVEAVLKTVYLVPALQGQVPQEELRRIGHECINTLRGHIKQIQEITGIEEGKQVAANANGNGHYDPNYWIQTTWTQETENGGALAYPSDSADEASEEERSNRLDENDQLFA